MNYKLFTIQFLRIFTLIFFNQILFAQENYPKFKNLPLKIPIELVGNFAELRSKHLHSGLDFRTQQVENFPIHSIDDGYVSRINISPIGYGKAVYINHSNGYTSVYAHCSRFAEKIETYIRKLQYEKKTFQIDVQLTADKLKITENELIAYSGNTGGSSGPHLHFEIRNTQTEEPINPLHFGLEVEDTIPPTIENIYIYPIDGTIHNKNKKFIIKDYKNQIPVSGALSFGVKTFDVYNATPKNKNGIYSIKTFVNNELYYTYSANKFHFDETRYIHALTDYQEYINHNQWIYRTYLLPGNKLRMFSDLKNNGILAVEENKNYQIKIEVTDYKNNTTSRTFNLVGKKYEKPKPTDKHYVQFDEPFQLELDNVFLDFKAGSFYENFVCKIKQINDKLHLHSSDFPIHKRFELKFDISKLDSLKRKKAKIVRETNAGKYKKEYLETKFENNFLISNPREFGIFSIEIDEKKPVIFPLKSKPNELKFKITDEQSGIKTYSIYLNNNWILAEYDKKSDILSCNLIKENITKGKHLLKVEVTDEAQNTEILEKTIEVK